MEDLLFVIYSTRRTIFLITSFSIYLVSLCAGAHQRIVMQQMHRVLSRDAVGNTFSRRSMNDYRNYARD